MVLVSVLVLAQDLAQCIVPAYIRSTKWVGKKCNVFTTIPCQKDTAVWQLLTLMIAIIMTQIRRRNTRRNKRTKTRRTTSSSTAVEIATEFRMFYSTSPPFFCHFFLIVFACVLWAALPLFGAMLLSLFSIGFPKAAKSWHCWPKGVGQSTANGWETCWFLTVFGFFASVSYFWCQILRIRNVFPPCPSPVAGLARNASPRIMCGSLILKQSRI